MADRVHTKDTSNLEGPLRELIRKLLIGNLDLLPILTLHLLVEEFIGESLRRARKSKPGIVPSLKSRNKSQLPSHIRRCISINGILLGVISISRPRCRQNRIHKRRSTQRARRALERNWSRNSKVVLLRLIPRRRRHNDNIVRLGRTQPVEMRMINHSIVLLRKLDVHLLCEVLEGLGNGFA